MLKLLLLVVVVMFGVWLWRKDRIAAQPKPPQTPKPANKKPSALPMVVCSHCGTHTDARDIVKGEIGVYCSESHRQLSGDRAKS